TCSTGPVQCCDSVQKSDAPEVQNALGLLNIPIGGVTGLVGLTCSPILGTLSSSSCSAQTVCCEDNSYGTLVSIGCLPITL
ncbi:fungal hydrophobin, partial [Trametes versicolor FP-101664 SS1]|uniref:fungal hydrophobin n=1 Tax=Trametes versicolor (strain FP-101664) TaxID=717944 RepID=UPI00046216B3